MAIAEGLAFKFRKSLGDLTVAKYKDIFVVKQKMMKPVTPPRYFDVQIQRSKMPNVVNFYKSTKGLLKESFPLGKPTANTCARFESANLSKSEVYITKDEARQGCTILYPYVVSSGGLETQITVSTQGSKQVSDICLGGLEITASTSVSELVYAIVKNNDAFDYGDRLTFVRATQLPARNGAQPKVSFRSVSVDLRIEKESPTLAGAGKSDGFLSVAVNGQNYLACSLVQDSLVAYTLSKLDDRGSIVDVSFARLAGPTPSLLADYSSNTALYNAIMSHGGVNKENHYSPNHLSWKQFKDKVMEENAGLLPGGGGNTGSGTGNTDPTVETVTITCVAVGANADKGTVSPATQTVEKDSMATCHATPQTGYMPRWSDGSTGGSYTFQATKSGTVEVEFTPIQNGGGGTPGLGS